MNEGRYQVIDAVQTHVDREGKAYEHFVCKHYQRLHDVKAVARER